MFIGTFFHFVGDASQAFRIHSAECIGDKADRICQIGIHRPSRGKLFEFRKDQTHLILQRFIHARITDDYDIPFLTAAGNIVLLCQARKPHSAVNLLVFLR